MSPADAARVKEIERTTNHDVKAVEYLIKERLKDDAELARRWSSCISPAPSEDINNLSYALMLNEARQECCCRALDELIAEAARAGARPRRATDAVAHPRPDRFADHASARKSPTSSRACSARAKILAGLPMPGKINGAVGNYNAHVVAYPGRRLAGVRRAASSNRWAWTGSPTPPRSSRTTASPRSCDARASASTPSLIDLCRDIWGYISLGYFKQAVKAGEVGSSTMPHKVNPIDFENAEGNFGIANALFEHFAAKLPISRWQRDLTDSTVLRALGTAFGHALIALDALQRGLGKLTVNPERLAADLDAAWEVLAEAVQTVMRRHGLPNPYEQLKALTRGQGITEASMREFIATLELPADAKQRLLGDDAGRLHRPGRAAGARDLMQQVSAGRCTTRRGVERPGDGANSA